MKLYTQILHNIQYIGSNCLKKHSSKCQKAFAIFFSCIAKEQNQYPLHSEHTLPYIQRPSNFKFYTSISFLAKFNFLSLQLRAIPVISFTYLDKNTCTHRCYLVLNPNRILHSLAIYPNTLHHRAVCSPTGLIAQPLGVL